MRYAMGPLEPESKVYQTRQHRERRSDRRKAEDRALSAANLGLSSHAAMESRRLKAWADGFFVGLLVAWTSAAVLVAVVLGWVL